jgi:hypothetical protein
LKTSPNRIHKGRHTEEAEVRKEERKGVCGTRKNFEACFIKRADGCDWKEMEGCGITKKLKALITNRGNTKSWESG